MRKWAVSIIEGEFFFAVESNRSSAIIPVRTFAPGLEYFIILIALLKSI